MDHGGRGDRDGSLEVSSESVILETYKERSKEMEAEPEVGTFDCSGRHHNQGAEKWGHSPSGGREEEQLRTNNARVAEVMLGLDSNLERLPYTDLNLVTIQLKFTATRVRTVGRPRGRGRRARGVITNSSRKRAYGLRIIDVDESAIQACKRR
ncbi:UNVERIFIED_CONTAM: hypothetical protein Sradi_6974600 [Sesamum radiatum]|uniref:Uncharacterized protein n=1 Tax=Sesamum radiatum TaxID=300843 RepID=A0AAW2JEI7_SESRA